MSKISLHPEDALARLNAYREDRECNITWKQKTILELPQLIQDARDARLKWREIALAAGVSRSYVMRVWKESNGVKT
jgi:AraC-like DNA-binding protein